MKIMFMIFPKRYFFGVSGPCWTQKWSILIMGLIVHGANSAWKVILMVYPKKFFFGANGSF